MTYINVPQDDLFKRLYEVYGGWTGCPCSSGMIFYEHATVFPKNYDLHGLLDSDSAHPVTFKNLHTVGYQWPRSEDFVVVVSHEKNEEGDWYFSSNLVWLQDEDIGISVLRATFHFLKTDRMPCFKFAIPKLEREIELGRDPVSILRDINVKLGAFLLCFSNIVGT